MSTSESSLPRCQVSAPTADVPSKSSIGSQIVKRKRGSVFRSLQKSIIANVHEFFDKKIEEQPIMVGNVLRRTSEALRYQRGLERRVEGDVSSPAEKDRKPSCGPAQQETDNFLEGVILRRVHRFYTNGELSTMVKLLLSLRDDVDYLCGRSTLYTTLRKVGFGYKTLNQKTARYEQYRIIAARLEYLRKILTFRSEGRPIVYLDEYWLNAHHTREHCWIDYDGKGCLRLTSRKGGRLIILHAGWEQGWITDAELLFRGKLELETTTRR